MKKIISLLSVVALIVLFATSCRKDNPGATITKVIPVELKMNETFIYKIPHVADSDNEMVITGQASNYLVSKLTPSQGTASMFEFTPALNYTGPDEVVISNQESHGKGGKGKCNGNKNDRDDTIIYHFKITIKGSASRTTN